MGNHAESKSRLLLNKPLDVKSSYPYTEIFLNVCKSTTLVEVCEIVGVSDQDRRICGINMTGGMTNAVDWCCTMYQLPRFDDALEAYLAEQEKEVA